MISDSMTSGLSLPVPLYAQSLCKGCRFKLHPLAQHSQSVCAGSVRYAILACHGSTRCFVRLDDDSLNPGATHRGFG